MLQAIDDDEVTRRIRAVKNPAKRYLLFSGRLPSQAIPERVARLDVRRPERVHVVRAETGANRRDFVARLLAVLGTQDEYERILDAWWEGDALVVLSPSFNRLHLPLAKLASLREHPREKLDEFQIDQEGDFVYWPAFDVHLGWEQFAQAVDDNAYLKARQRSDQFNRRYGSAIRAIRQQRQLRQSDIDGLTARQVGRIERGQCRATHSALSKLAKAHKMSVSDYMQRLAVSAK